MDIEQAFDFDMRYITGRSAFDWHSSVLVLFLSFFDDGSGGKRRCGWVTVTVTRF
jgi:hypothetical protein